MYYEMFNKTIKHVFQILWFEINQVGDLKREWKAHCIKYHLSLYQTKYLFLFSLKNCSTSRIYNEWIKINHFVPRVTNFETFWCNIVKKKKVYTRKMEKLYIPGQYITSSLLNK